MPKLSRKSITENWMGIANLILTATIGIVVAIYLAYRNENLQKQIVTLQSDIQRQADLANLELSSVCINPSTCAGAIEIRNNGLATAKNIRLAVYIGSITDIWKSEIGDINQFTFATDKPSLKFKSQDIKINTLYSEGVDGNNAIEILFDMPTKTQARFAFSLSDSVLTKNVKLERNTTLYFPAQKNLAWYFYVDKPLKRYLEKQASIVQLVANVSCDNCEGNTNEVGFIVTTLGEWGYGSGDVIQSGETDTAQIPLWVNYLIPLSSSYVPPTTPLRLQITEINDKTEPEIYEIRSP
jgi:hypothetical protein